MQAERQPRVPVSDRGRRRLEPVRLRRRGLGSQRHGEGGDDGSNGSQHTVLLD